MVSILTVWFYQLREGYRAHTGRCFFCINSDNVNFFRINELIHNLIQFRALFLDGVNCLLTVHVSQRQLSVVLFTELLAEGCELFIKLIIVFKVPFHPWYNMQKCVTEALTFLGCDGCSWGSVTFFDCHWNKPSSQGQFKHLCCIKLA